MTVLLGLLLPLAASGDGPIATAWLLERDGVVRGERNADAHLPAASLGKLMTAVLWLQRPERLEQTLSISERAAAATGARAGLGQGERYLGRDLLAAMLVRSANDACLALAEKRFRIGRGFRAGHEPRGRGAGTRRYPIRQSLRMGCRGAILHRA
ncbi:MAG: serine hydrolase [Gammaproteobacteria bacterium]|nr:serine hydrolase [Gammaproteobacteria bacterium]